MFYKITTLTAIILSTSAIAPEMVSAQISKTNISVTCQPQETYEKCLSRADSMAKTEIQQRFNQNKSLQAIDLTVSGEHQGSIAPLLSLQVSRQEWNSLPNPKHWGTYYSSSKLLLGFEKPATASKTPPPPPSAANPSETPPPPPGGETPSPTPTTTPPANQQPTANQPQSTTTTTTTTTSSSSSNSGNTVDSDNSSSLPTPLNRNTRGNVRRSQAQNSN